MNDNVTSKTPNEAFAKTRDYFLGNSISIESGKLTAEQKKELIERLTATASEITHIPEQFFMVTIKEVPDENFGIGGKSIDEIKRNYKP